MIDARSSKFHWFVRSVDKISFTDFKLELRVLCKFQIFLPLEVHNHFTADKLVGYSG